MSTPVAQCSNEPDVDQFPNALTVADRVAKSTRCVPHAFGVLSNTADRTRRSSERSKRQHTQHGSACAVSVGQVCKVPGFVFNQRQVGNLPHKGITYHFAPVKALVKDNRGGNSEKLLAHVLGITSLAAPGWVTQSKKPRVCTRGQPELPPGNARDFQNDVSSFSSSSWPGTGVV